MSKLRRRLMALFTANVLFLASLLPASAQEDIDAYFDRQQRVMEVMEAIKDVHNEQLSKIHEDLDAEILEKGLDYDLTYEALMQAGDPLSQLDYIGLLAAYMACRQTQGRKMAYGDLQVFQVKKEPATLHETIPVRVPEYTQVYPGRYEETGYRYSTMAQQFHYYEPDGEGMYRQTEEMVRYEPTVQDTAYEIVTITPAGPKDIFTQMGVPMQGAAYEDYKKIREYLSFYVTNGGVYTFAKGSDLYWEKRDEQMDAQIAAALEKIEQAKKQQAYEKEWSGMNEARAGLVETAVSLVGKVPYLWGGKARQAGYDPSWWTLLPNGKKNGLDCSGFVQWAYITAGFPEEVTNKLATTQTILSTCQTVDKEDLQPGDIGLLNWGESTNHCGIYIGDGQFVHCSSGKGTVTVSAFPFKVFKRVQIENINLVDNSTFYVYHGNNSTNPLEICGVSREDVVLLAKLMMNEAAGEGINGMAAVAEVVANRIASDVFPDTVPEVIYQKNGSVSQFSDNDRIAMQQPTNEVVELAAAVLAGKLKVLGDTDVLFFRRPPDNALTADWGSYPYFTRIGHHTFYKIQ